MFTALLIAILVVAGAATVVGGGLVLASRRKGLAESSEPKLLTDGRGNLLSRTVQDLRVGDVVQYDGRDFVVEGVLSYDEDGHRWSSGRLVDMDRVRWLVVGMERGGAGSLRLLSDDTDLEVSGYPPEKITLANQRYSLEKRGNATVKVSGDAAILGAPKLSQDSVTRCRWWRYEAAGHDSMVVEQWGSTFRVLRGKEVKPSDVEFIPGS